MVVRVTVGAAAGVIAPLEVVATVVVTVCVVVYDDGAGAWVCADASAAAAEKTMARNAFFTIVLDLGEIEISNPLYGEG